nr:hypothetical protein [Flavobacterium azizsancarii]
MYVLFATKTLSVVLIVKLNISKISEVFPFTFGDAVILNSLALVVVSSFFIQFTSDLANASAESFNAKVKAFRSQFRGVRKVDFG